jgi:hypothetical protein
MGVFLTPLSRSSIYNVVSGGVILIIGHHKDDAATNFRVSVIPKEVPAAFDP